MSSITGRTHADTPIRIGTSSCLLGQPVRYNGEHKRDAYITGTLAAFFELVPVCPEMAIGLGVPRDPIRLTGDLVRPRAVGVHDPARDVTAVLEDYGRCVARELAGLSGYILKNRSPSCGLQGVPVFRDDGQVAGAAAGVYARALTAALPLLPVEEETRLADPAARRNFIERVFAYRRWQALLTSGLTAARLAEFHAVHALTLMAHGARHCRRLSRLLARPEGSPDGLARDYGATFMQALKDPATRRRHTGVLLYALRRLKLSSAERDELRRSIAAYQAGRVSLREPVALLCRHAGNRADEFLVKQVYLHPHELMLRGE
ncbi:MAG: DUF1722 domain-containing protein [Gammaproteobacteria bacterium]|nr:DUF1722 domain-containing protein [Gammaproteobacteria bacterium]